MFLMKVDYDWISFLAKFDKLGLLGEALDLEHYFNTMIDISTFYFSYLFSVNVSFFLSPF